jgi:cold shock CspA family protein
MAHAPARPHEPIFNEISAAGDQSCIGHTKWFNDKLGYGFITICDGPETGRDIFVHHSGIKPLNSNYKTLRKGEYVQFCIHSGSNGLQAVGVCGIKGGPLMCDANFVSGSKKTKPVGGKNENCMVAQPPTATAT